MGNHKASFVFLSLTPLPSRLPQRESALGALRDFLESNHIRFDPNKLPVDETLDGPDVISPAASASPGGDAAGMRGVQSSAAEAEKPAAPPAGPPRAAGVTGSTQEDDLPPSPAAAAARRSDDADAPSGDSPALAAGEPSQKRQRLALHPPFNLPTPAQPPLAAAAAPSSSAGATLPSTAGAAAAMQVKSLAFDPAGIMVNGARVNRQKLLNVRCYLPTRPQVPPAAGVNRKHHRHARRVLCDCCCSLLDIFAPRGC